jgi:hypothetical protein
MNTFLAWEPRSHESRRKAIGSRFMKMRLLGRERTHDVIIEKVYKNGNYQERQELRETKDTLTVLLLR